MEEQGLSPFSAAFLAGDPRAEPFLPSTFRSAEARRACVQRARSRRAHPDLAGALRGLEARLPRSEARARNIAALAEPGTIAVVTGQQVALFLGPLYCVYKAATAIACARALEAETGSRCVPVFWLQTEDHDFDEIDHCHVLDDESGEVVKLALPPSPGARASVREARLGEAVGGLLERLPAGEVRELFSRWYRPEATLSDAFAGVMAALFSDEGLVFVDPRDPALARAAAPVHAKAISDAGPLSHALLAREAALKAAGFAVQVAVRPGAPLSFFHPEGAAGPRFRLDGSLRFVGREGGVSREALLRAVEETPERFSTSALLRPVLQDTLLPTAAICGGPGELNYFAQVGPLYEAYGLPMPMLVPRARFRVVDPRTRRALEALKLTAAEVEAPYEEVLRRARPAVPDGFVAPEAVERQLVAAADAALAGVSLVPDAVKRTRATIVRAASRFAGRYRRAIDSADQVVVERVRRVQSSIFPDGVPQERVLGLPSLAARCGVKAFVRLVLDSVSAWSSSVKDLSP